MGSSSRRLLNQSTHEKINVREAVAPKSGAACPTSKTDVTAVALYPSCSPAIDLWRSFPAVQLIALCPT